MTETQKEHTLKPVTTRTEDRTMDRNTIAESLRALAQQDQNRSKAARFRDVYEDVESALTAGVSRTVVIDELAKHGLKMTLATFATTLARERERRKKEGSFPQKVAPSTPPGEAKPAPVESEHDEQETVPAASSNPNDIDAIISSSPDLEALAKHVNKRTRK